MRKKKAVNESICFGYEILSVKCFFFVLLLLSKGVILSRHNVVVSVVFHPKNKTQSISILFFITNLFFERKIKTKKKHIPRIDFVIKEAWKRLSPIIVVFVAKTQFIPSPLASCVPYTSSSFGLASFLDLFFLFSTFFSIVLFIAFLLEILFC